MDWAAREALGKALLPTAELALYALADRVDMADMSDAQCAHWPWLEPGILVMTLWWRAGDGVGRNIHVAICLEWWDPCIIVEGNAWKEGSGADESAGRNEQFGEIDGVARLPSAAVEYELDRCVAVAFDRLSSLTTADLDDRLRGKPFGDRFDPGPLTTESYLGE